MATTFINGKFTAQRRTGVQRYAHELVLALDALIAANGGADGFVLVCPPRAQVPSLRAIGVQVSRGPRLPLHLWEQLVLPLKARGGRLLSLTGSAPLLARRQVCTIHDAAVYEHPQAYSRVFVAWYRMLFGRAAVHAELLLTVSRFSAQRLALWLGQPESVWKVIPGAADHLDTVCAKPAVLARLGLQPGRFLLAVASENPTKNLARLVAAFALLPPRADLVLVLVGGSNARVFASAHQEADPPGVVRAGLLDDGELKALYEAARALVCPSLYEGFGLPPVEAMRLGCPVAVSAEGALPEVCGDAAFTLDPFNPARLAQGLQLLVDDDDLCVRLRASGLARTLGMRWRESARLLLEALRAPRRGG